MTHLILSGRALPLLAAFALALPLLTSQAQEAWEQPVALIEEENYSAALDALDAALVGDPTDSILLRLKGYVLFITDRDAEAVPVLESAVDADPTDLAARYYLAQAQAYAGRINASISGLETLIAMDPGSEYAGQAQEWLPQLRALQVETVAEIASESSSETFDSPVEHVTLDEAEQALVLRPPNRPEIRQQRAGQLR